MARGDANVAHVLQKSHIPLHFHFHSRSHARLSRLEAVVVIGCAARWGCWWAARRPAVAIGSKVLSRVLAAIAPKPTAVEVEGVEPRRATPLALAVMAVVLAAGRWVRRSPRRWVRCSPRVRVAAPRPTAAPLEAAAEATAGKDNAEHEENAIAEVIEASCAVEPPLGRPRRRLSAQRQCVVLSPVAPVAAADGVASGRCGLHVRCARGRRGETSGLCKVRGRGWRRHGRRADGARDEEEQVHLGCGPSANHRRVARGVDALRALWSRFGKYSVRSLRYHASITSSNASCARTCTRISIVLHTVVTDEALATAGMSNISASAVGRTRMPCSRSR